MAQAPSTPDGPRVLVTGATGFAGGHLVEALLAHGAQVFGLGRGTAWPGEWAHLDGRVPLHGCDLARRGEVEGVLRAVQPDHIYHLAGYAHAGRSFREADAAWEGNLTATRNLYDAVAAWGGRPRILFIGSGQVYGDAAGPDAVQHEDSPLRPTSPYAASKAAADLLSYQVTRAPGLDVVRARPCNHVGPRQAPQYAVASFARQVAAIARGTQPPVLETGDLSARRDLTDVRDTVAAYLLLLEHGQTGEAYNVASGRICSMGEVLDRLLALAGVRAEVRQQPGLLRAADVAVARVDAAKLARATGWRPRFTLDQTLSDTLAYWRGQP